MLQHLRAGWNRVMAVPAAVLLRIGLGPDAVTVIGAVLTCLAALLLLPAGLLWQGALVLALLVLTDGVDGAMARRLGRSSPWGAFLDSTMDRLADGVLMIAVLLHLLRTDAPHWLLAVTLWGLLAAQLTSYVKARADSVGLACAAGLFSRAERWVVLLAGVLLTGLGVAAALPVALVLLAIASTVTVIQRLASVRTSARESR